jgi:hypothetical protein
MRAEVSSESELGIPNPTRHVMLILESEGKVAQSPATFIFKKSEFTDDEVRTIEAVASANNFKLLYTPLNRPVNVFTEMMEAADPSEVWSKHETNVAPTYDNNPFFFNSVRAGNIMSVLTGSAEWQKTNIGTFVLFSLFAITFALVVLFILGPLMLVRRRDFLATRSTKVSALLYFACLGGGFIIVEVAMIQKFILFLGHPVYALTVVLFSLLLFSALGGYLSGRLIVEPTASSLSKLLILLCGVIFSYILLLPPIFYGLVYLNHPVRICIAVVLMAPLALLMGMPLPLGMRMIEKRAPEIIPWSWGVNGATSVMGSVSALVIAILSGFNQALVVGAALYFLAAFFIVRVQRAALASA